MKNALWLFLSGVLTAAAAGFFMWRKAGRSSSDVPKGAMKSAEQKKQKAKDTVDEVERRGPDDRTRSDDELRDSLGRVGTGG